MTRSDYYTIALALAHAKPAPHEQTPDAMRTWERTVRTIADSLEAENPRFDAARFACACTIEAL